MPFRVRLAYAMKLRGMSQRELGRRIGLKDGSQIGKYLRDGVKHPGLRRQGELERALAMPPGFLDVVSDQERLELLEADVMDHEERLRQLEQSSRKPP
jgi:transcriptional regulator with XRE-family HTH domain